MESLTLTLDPKISPSFPDLRTPKEIAILLKVSPKSIYWWVQRNEIPYIRVGRHLRFDAQAVLAWLTAKTEESKPACLQARPVIQRSESTGSLKNWNAGRSHQTKE